MTRSTGRTEFYDRTAVIAETTASIGQGGTVGSADSGGMGTHVWIWLQGSENPPTRGCFSDSATHVDGVHDPRRTRTDHPIGRSEDGEGGG